MDCTSNHTVTRCSRIALAVVFALLGFLAWHNRFMQDDAFISFRYAENFVHGNGLVWNPGERIEGYTNFLWTLLMSVPIALHLDPVRVSLILGVAFFLLTLWMTYRLGLLLLDSAWLALLAVVLLGTNYSFSAYATGGLETQMQTALLTTFAWLCFTCLKSSAMAPSRLILLSATAVLAFLTRMDSAAYLFLPGCVLAIMILRLPASASQRIGRLTALVLPALLVAGLWLIWKYHFYGALLPNTYYAKVASSWSSIQRGTQFIFIFIQSYWLMGVIFLILAAGPFLLNRSNRLLAWITLTILLWCLYVIEVGGDFMEFRFLVPILPLFFLLVTGVLTGLVKQVPVRVAFVTLILAGSLHHYRTFQSVNGIEPVARLQQHLYEPQEAWAQAGRTMGARFFNSATSVVIATTAAGAIPYYSRLQSVDMLGLNDPWVARNGTALSPKPGHQRIAPLSYLMRRGVNLVVGQPQIVAIGQNFGTTCPLREIRRFWWGLDVAIDAVPAGAKLIEIPLNGEWKLIVLYLEPHPYIDDMIRKYHLKTLTIVTG